MRGTMRVRLHPHPPAWMSALAIPLRLGLASVAGLRCRLSGWVRRAGYRPERRYMRGGTAGGQGGRGSAAAGQG
jgi:hypothetical protein